MNTNNKTAANKSIYDPTNPFDPAADIFRLMNTVEYADLKRSIKQNGLREPITTQNGKIIDGRSRYKACKELGIEPNYIELNKDASSMLFIIDKNLMRRHLSDFDKVEIAQKMSMLPIGSNQHTAGAGRSQKVIADLLHTSPDTLQRGRKIFNKGTEALKDALREGKISVSVGAMLADLPKEKQDQIAQNEITTINQLVTGMNTAKQTEKRVEKTKLLNELAKSNPTLDGVPRSSVIYADPPWHYLGFDGTPYPTMPLEDICALKVEEHCTDDAVLLMWAPSAMLPSALKVIEAWGFDYKTSAVWDKQTPGQGGYFRQQHEFLLLATKGNPPTVDPTTTSASVISLKRGEHSAKPHSFYALIEKMYPDLGKLELFSRNKRDGWTMWGNQAGDKLAA